jgi:hypothetical protein
LIALQLHECLIERPPLYDYHECNMAMFAQFPASREARDSERKPGPGLCFLFPPSLSSECHLLLFANGLSEVTLPTTTTTRKTDAGTNCNVLSTAHRTIHSLHTCFLQSNKAKQITARLRELVVRTRTDSSVDRRRERKRLMRTGHSLYKVLRCC